MANKDAPFGFRSVGKKGGGVANGGVTEYEIASGATGNIFSGDPVKMVQQQLCWEYSEDASSRIVQVR